MEPFNGVKLYGEGIIEVTLTKEKTKTPEYASINTPDANKQKTKKGKSTSNSESQENWGLVFGKQSILEMLKVQSPKSTKNILNKGTRKELNVQKQQRNNYNDRNKHMYSTPSKNPSQTKSEENFKTRYHCEKPLLSTSINSITSVECDRVIQCPETYNSSRFNDFNPVRTLSFLIKELQDLVKKDKRTDKVFSEMEQILTRLSVGSEKLISEDLGTIFIYPTQEEITVKLKELEELNEKMKIKCESLALEKDTLQSQIQNQDACLREANKKEADLKNQADRLMQQLEEVTQKAMAKDNMISVLKEKIKNDELLSETISNLRTELDKQMELAHNKHCEIEYLKIEKDKLSMSLSYKDTLNNELRNTITELQNHMTALLSELATLHEAYEAHEAREEDASPQVSIRRTGFINSSPNSNSSDHSNHPVFRSDLSDSSISTVESITQKHVLKKDAVIKDTAHFISLSGEETANSIVPDSYRN